MQWKQSKSTKEQYASAIYIYIKENIPNSSGSVFYFFIFLFYVLLFILLSLRITFSNFKAISKIKLNEKWSRFCSRSGRLHADWMWAVRHKAESSAAVIIHTQHCRGMNVLTYNSQMMMILLLVNQSPRSSAWQTSAKKMRGPKLFSDGWFVLGVVEMRL